MKKDLNEELARMKTIMNVMVEAEYNYHIGDVDLDNPDPHYSDNIYRMQGRGTGHFGSGMYFSTFKQREPEDYDKKYGEYSGFKPNKPNLIKVNDNLYRVDFDIYKNLYRVTSNNHGELLFKTLKELNNLFYLYDKYGNAHSDIGRRYMIILNNMHHLRLKLPKYKEFLKMMEIAKKDYNKGYGNNKPSSYASFSTRIMEWNGYNGVNVSGLSDWDNTLHGSVIYDVNKIGGDLKPVKIDMFAKINKSGVISSDYSDVKAKMLSNERLFKNDIDKLNELPLSTGLALIKRYYNWIDYYFDLLNDELKKAYLNTLHKKLIDDEDMVSSVNSLRLEFLIDHNLMNIIYDPRIKKQNETLLSIAFYEFRFKGELINKLINGINRELNDDEKESLQNAKEYL